VEANGQLINWCYAVPFVSYWFYWWW